MCEAADRVPDGIVDRARAIPSRHMDDDRIAVRRRDRRCKHLTAVALNEHDSGNRSRQYRYHRHYLRAERERHVVSIVPRIYGMQWANPVAFDLRAAGSELWREVHAGHDQLELERG